MDKRKYASFFEWHDKARKELGVTEELLTALNAAASATCYHSPVIHTPDPPDCVCLNAGNESVAVEVVEVVDQQAIHLNEMGQSVYRVWNLGELAEHVRELLRRKDAKVFHGGPYAETIACLLRTRRCWYRMRLRVS